MRIVSFQTEKEPKLLALGDLHIGDNPEIVNNILASIDEHNPDFVFLLGDIINGNSRDSISNPFETRITPEEELEIAVKFITQLSNKTNIACAIRGNHEYRMSNKFGVDVLSPVFQTLNIAYDDIVLVDLSISDNHTGSRGRVNYTIACTHGISNGRYEESSIRQGRFFKEFISSGIDLYITAHTHKPTVSWITSNEFDKHNKKIFERNATIINVTGLQQSSYAERKLLRPSPWMLIYITLLKNKRQQKIETVFIT